MRVGFNTLHFSYIYMANRTGVTQAICNNIIFVETTPFETTPYASPKQRVSLMRPSRVRFFFWPPDFGQPRPLRTAWANGRKRVVQTLVVLVCWLSRNILASS